MTKKFSLRDESIKLLPIFFQIPYFKSVRQSDSDCCKLYFGHFQSEHFFEIFVWLKQPRVHQTFCVTSDLCDEISEVIFTINHFYTILILLVVKINCNIFILMANKKRTWANNMVRVQNAGQIQSICCTKFMVNLYQAY